MCLEDRPILEANAAGIDIGAREIFVAVPPDRDEHPVRKFTTFTEDLEKMAQWLVSCGITTVAMESTGVYWIPLYDVVEQHGVKACLVDARGMKNVPGRRTDWHECQWLQFLHSVGLLRAAFRPEGDVCAVRSVMRHRTELVEMTSQHIQHMHKALTQMNVQIHHVISDLTGVTGLAIVDAIIGGERNPDVLAKLRDPHIKASEETIRKSLVGNWRGEHLFTLQQSRQSYQHYQEQITTCDEEIEKMVLAFVARVDPAEKPLPPDRKRKQRGRKKKNVNPKTGFDLRTESYKLFGVDLTQIPGLMAMVLMLFSEVGRDMSRWPTAAHFVSWLALCPDNDISGGRVLWRGMRRVHNRAGDLFRMAAYALHHDQTPLGDYLRRMKSKLGPAGATTATAHKIAIIFYTMVKKQVEYDATLWAERDAQREKRFDAKLKRQAQQRGYKLVPIEETSAA
ncbi:transposase [Candidatus Sulfopaludibacter sp. SbA3]|nr:transposase [Candidatus Sulfopaludibacter sp. SbA3]